MNVHPRFSSGPGRLLAGAALAIALLAASASAQAQMARSCGVALAQGQVALERKGQSLGVAAGAVLAAGDRLVTGVEARAEIRCNDGIRLNVGAETRLELSTLVAGGPARQNVVLRLLDGIVRVALPTIRSWRSFEVQTPTAVASVRSTDWIVQAEKSGATAVFVVEGQVLAANRAGSEGAFLNAGEGIDFRADGGMQQSTRWGEARVSRTLAAVMPR
ncbi:MAG: FecR domain-containing protein [Reyranellaceae bacterium]